MLDAAGAGGDTPRGLICPRSIMAAYPRWNAAAADRSSFTESLGMEPQVDGGDGNEKLAEGSHGGDDGGGGKHGGW